MKSQSKSLGIVFFLLTVIAFALACSTSGTAPNNAPAFDPTKAALELQNTAVALQLTQSAMIVPTQQVDQSAQSAPTEPPVAASTPEAPQTSQVPPEIQKLVEDYSGKGYLPSTQGEYHRLDDFTMSSADRQVTFSKKKTSYDVKDFMVKAHFKWQSAIANPDPGGCGWAFRGSRDSTYFTFVDREWIFFGLMKEGKWTRYGKTSGNDWVGLGNPAEADVTLTVSKGKAYMLLNDVLASSYTLDTDFLTSAGELDYAVVAGTFKDYGTRCEMTNVDLWIANP
jgi:hypothetical protein